MGVVGSLPSPLPAATSLTNDNIKTLYEESMPSNDDFSYCIIPKSEEDSNSNSASISDNRSTFSINEQQTEENPVNTISRTNYVKIHRATAPTLATGRRSKFMHLEGDAAAKRELRRQRNREAARKLKEKRITLEQKLNHDIEELETKEQELLSKIKLLESHKQLLETQYKHIISIQETLALTADSTLKYIQRNRQRLNPDISIHRNNMFIKEELNPPSPQWQTYFSI